MKVGGHTLCERRSNVELTGGVRKLKVGSEDTPRMEITEFHAFKNLFVGHVAWSTQQLHSWREGATPDIRIHGGRRGAAEGCSPSRGRYEVW